MNANSVVAASPMTEEGAKEARPVPLVSQLLWLPHMVVTMLVLIALYLVAIFQMDGIACFNTPQCYTYTNIEWSFGSDAFSMSLATWTAQGRSAMAFSAGLHIFSSFLFNAFFLSGSLLVRKLLVRLLASKLDWIEGWIDFIAGWVPMASLTFNFFYCFAHTTIAAYIVAGLPVKATGVLTFASTCIVIALALLILIALFLLFSAAFLALRFAREKLASKGQSQIQVLPHAAQSNSIHTV